MTVTAGTHGVNLSAMGTVIPSRSITLKSRVGGFVKEKSKKMIPGGLFKKGEIMLRLEEEDFLLNVARQKSALAKLQAGLRLEMGKQEVAREELKILQNGSKRPISNADLALREPQLAQIKADIAGAETDLARANLDLERTIVKAPFNCMVMTVNVEPGSQISSQDTLASLTGTDDYWVQASLPTDQLKWVDFPLKTHGQGSPAWLTTRDNPPRPGHVIRLLGKLTNETRLATLLITIEDPLGLQRQGRSPLLLDSYVNIRIKGTQLSQVIALPRKLVRDGDQVWCVDDNRKLIIKPIDAVWRDEQHIFVSGGLEPGDQIVVSDMSSPVEGMTLQVQGQVPSLPPDISSAPAGKADPSLKNHPATTSTATAGEEK
jgi:RND family efflux transporter MFP subunit